MIHIAYNKNDLRYIFLYGEFLNSKKISINNEGNFDAYKEKIQELEEEKYKLETNLEKATFSFFFITSK